ncbi:glycoside hydrolase family 88 protein [Modestobacter sp. NPDC049651]|uniref:glycoside hydrolase family 88 protein n=1 Tax=unclassified Modestobacter TaxID=2643866 RepID=UPI0033E8BAD3
MPDDAVPDNAVLDDVVLDDVVLDDVVLDDVVLDDGTRRRALGCLLVTQRHSWDQALLAAVLADAGETGLLRALVDDAVARQLPDGRLAELDPACAVNGAALLAFLPPGDAADRQLRWLLHGAPRAADGTLFHLVGTPQVWADTVFMAVPALAAAGQPDAALAQLTGHRRRLRDDAAGLWAARWDDDRGAPADPRHWGTGNGWVAAGLARAVPHLPAAQRSPVAAEVRALLDACLALRRPDGRFGDVLDDPRSPADTTVGAMLAWAALTGAALGWLPARYGEVGADLLTTVTGFVDGLGRVTGASAAPTYDRPGHSPEAQAFLLLADAAARRWRETSR